MTTRDRIPLSKMPQPAQVEAMAGYGLSTEDIAKVLDIDIDTVRANCRHEQETGAIKANLRVAESLFRMAVAGEGRESVTAAIFWLKTRARWRETTTHEHAVTWVSHEDVLDQLT